MVPPCTGALLSVNRALKAAARAASMRRRSLTVEPLGSKSALVTLPSGPTVTRTTTLPLCVPG